MIATWYQVMERQGLASRREKISGLWERQGKVMKASKNPGNLSEKGAGPPEAPPFRLIVIGSSLGGLRALEVILASLPPDFPAPLALVQDRQSDGDPELVRLLQHFCRLPVVEPEHDFPGLMPRSMLLNARRIKGTAPN